MSPSQPDVQHRLRRLERRSSSRAREVLRQFAEHHKFAELVDRLEQMSGTLYQLDVVSAFASILERGSRIKRAAGVRNDTSRHASQP